MVENTDNLRIELENKEIVKGLENAIVKIDNNQEAWETSLKKLDHLIEQEKKLWNRLLPIIAVTSLSVYLTIPLVSNYIHYGLKLLNEVDNNTKLQILYGAPLGTLLGIFGTIFFQKIQK